MFMRDSLPLLVKGQVMGILTDYPEVNRRLQQMFQTGRYWSIESINVPDVKDMTAALASELPCYSGQAVIAVCNAFYVDIFTEAGFVDATGWLTSPDDKLHTMYHPNHNDYKSLRIPEGDAAQLQYISAYTSVPYTRFTMSPDGSNLSKALHTHFGVHLYVLVQAHYETAYTLLGATERALADNTGVPVLLQCASNFVPLFTNIGFLDKSFGLTIESGMRLLFHPNNNTYTVKKDEDDLWNE